VLWLGGTRGLARAKVVHCIQLEWWLSGQDRARKRKGTCACSAELQGTYIHNYHLSLSAGGALEDLATTQPVVLQQGAKLTGESRHTVMPYHSHLQAACDSCHRSCHRLWDRSQCLGIHTHCAFTKHSPHAGHRSLRPHPKSKSARAHLPPALHTHLPPAPHAPATRPARTCHPERAPAPATSLMPCLRREPNDMRSCHARAWGTIRGPRPRCQAAFHERQALLGSRRPRVRMREHTQRRATIAALLGSIHRPLRRLISPAGGWRCSAPAPMH